MTTKPMQIAERTVADVTILTLTGRLILEEGDAPLRDYVNELTRLGRVKIVLDLRDVSRVDSAGLGMLAAKYLTVHRFGGALKLLRPPERASHLLRITKLEAVFEIFQTEEDALRSFLPSPQGT